MSSHTADRFSTQLGKRHRPLSRRVSLRHTLAMALLWCESVSLTPVQRAAAEPSDAVGGEDRCNNLGNGVLEDERTKLQWLQDDNGDDIDWNDAKVYCEKKRGGWRIPSLQQIKSIYDERERGVRCAEANCKLSSQFHLTGIWFWSATQVGQDSTDGIELARSALMVNGAQTQTDDWLQQHRYAFGRSFGERYLRHRVIAARHENRDTRSSQRKRSNIGGCYRVVSWDLIIPFNS